MKKSICRTLTHIDVAARSSVQLQAPITKTFSTPTPLITINRIPCAKIKILTLQTGLAAKEVAAHGEADSPSFKPSKIRLNIA
jgi:hypothetical protein